jgi:hypothetical protein
VSFEKKPQLNRRPGSQVISIQIKRIFPRRRANPIAPTVNIKSEAQQKKLKTVRGSHTDLDLSIHAKKGPKNLMTHSL